MTRFRITESAIRDVEEIWDYVAADSPFHADRLIDSIYEEMQRIRVSPGIGHRRDDIGVKTSVLFWSVARYLIVYRTDTAETVILSVLHGSRDVPQVLRQREPEE